MPNPPLIEPLDTFLSRPAPPWLIEDVLPACDLACIYAPWGQGKSFVGAELAGALTQGRVFGGHQTRKSLVLYLIGEGTFDMQERFRSMIDERSIDKEAIYISTAAPQVTQKEVLVELRVETRKWLEGRHLGAIIVDTLAVHAVGVEENSAHGLGILLALYRSLAAEFGATVVFIHHAGKEADKGARGSTALPGAVSTLIYCEKEGDDITLHCVKQRGAREFLPIGFAMRRVNGSAVLDPISAIDAFTDLEQLILDVLVSTKGPVCATRDFVWPDGKVPPKMSLHRALGDLMNRKIVNRIRRGLYSKSQSTN